MGSRKGAGSGSLVGEERALPPPSLGGGLAQEQDPLLSLPVDKASIQRGFPRGFPRYIYCSLGGSISSSRRVVCIMIWLFALCMLHPSPAAVTCFICCSCSSSTEVDLPSLLPTWHPGAYSLLPPSQHRTTTCTIACTQPQTTTTDRQTDRQSNRKQKHSTR